MFIEALETATCFEEGVIESSAAANIGSIMGIGFPANSGGAAQFMTGYQAVDEHGECVGPIGLEAFLARADRRRHLRRAVPPVDVPARDGGDVLGNPALSQGMTGRPTARVIPSLCRWVHDQVMNTRTALLASVSWQGQDPSVRMRHRSQGDRLQADRHPRWWRRPEVRVGLRRPTARGAPATRDAGEVLTPRSARPRCARRTPAPPSAPGAARPPRASNTCPGGSSFYCPGVRIRDSAAKILRVNQPPVVDAGLRTCASAWSRRCRHRLEGTPARRPRCSGATAPAVDHHARARGRGSTGHRDRRRPGHPQDTWRSSSSPATAPTSAAWSRGRLRGSTSSSARSCAV
jgi:hypothetical protein